MDFKTISKIKYFLYSNSNTEIMLGVLSGRDVRKSLETRAVRCTSKVMTIVAGKKVSAQCRCDGANCVQTFAGNCLGWRQSSRTGKRTMKANWIS